MPEGGRIRAFDWLRGLATLFMIQCHALVLLKPEYASTRLFHRLVWLDGLVAPSFIFAAGFSLALVQVRGASSGSRARRVRKTLRRLTEVLLVAALVNWMWFPIFREGWWLLRIDILGCIGLSLLVALPIISGLAGRPKVLSIVCACLAAVVFGLSPLGDAVRGWPVSNVFNGTAGASGSIFPLFPWAGYVYLGAAVGAATAAGGIQSAVKWTVGVGLVGAICWVLTPVFLKLYPPHNFWITDPANHGQRVVYVSVLLLGLLAAENLIRGGWTKSAPVRFVEVFGTSSMAAYFWHLFLLYYQLFGLGFSFNAYWGKRCDWGSYAWLVELLILATFALAWLTDRAYRFVNAKLDALGAERPAAKSAVAQ